MEKTEFKAESKRLLDLMINSIYTHKEIFLREIISNASDATDKRYYNALVRGETGLTRDMLPIDIAIDEQARTLTVSDRGCGMTKDELVNNLGTIAKSGSLAFKQENEKMEDVDIIGQFGVGFYSAFMVSSNVKVITKSEETGEAYCWESEGADGFTVTPAERAEIGTDIIMTIKESTEEENYDSYLDGYHISRLVKKYSDYISYPIKMAMQRKRAIEGSDPDNIQYEDYTEIETLNSMVPIWKKSKSEVTQEDYNRFYREKFFDSVPPARVIYTSTEGTATYNALLFVPMEPFYNYYSKNFEKGLQLYANGVLIMEKCADLLPDYFSFVRGIVDSQDLTLNISRETLQHDRQLKIIAANVEKKIKSELETFLKNDRENYEKFYKGFGTQLKYGAYENYGAGKETVKDILLFYSSSEEKLVSLAEYVSRMKAEQKYIYYVCGTSIDQINTLPQIEMLKDKGYEVLYLTEMIDEFALKMMRVYAEKEFKSISDGDLELESEEEKQEAEKKAEEHKALFDQMKDALGGQVTKVKLSSRLKSHPVCLSVEGPVSLEMEKVLNNMPGNDIPVKAQRVLELNGEHPIFAKLCRLQADDPEQLKVYTDILYNQALLMEGLTPDNPTAFCEEICKLMM